MSGDITYYDEWKFHLSSCGKPYENINPYLAALGFDWMQPAPNNNPNNHPLCGDLYCLMVSGAKGTIIVKITDSCAGCAKGDVDVSNEVYDQVADF